MPFVMTFAPPGDPGTTPGGRPAFAANTSFGKSQTTNRDVAGSKAGALVKCCWSCQALPNPAYAGCSPLGAPGFTALKFALPVVAPPIA